MILSFLNVKFENLCFRLRDICYLQSNTMIEFKNNFLSQNKYNSKPSISQNGQLNLIHDWAPFYHLCPQRDPIMALGVLHKRLREHHFIFALVITLLHNKEAWSPANSLLNSGAEIFAKSKPPNIGDLNFWANHKSILPALGDTALRTYRSPPSLS